VSLFRRKPVVIGGPTGVPGLAELASANGLRPVEGRVFDGHLEDGVHHAVRALRGQPHSVTTFSHVVVGNTTFSDAHAGTIRGRAVTVANGWTEMEPDPRVAVTYHGAAVCAVELPTVLEITGIEPRRHWPAVTGPESPTGDPSFDERYRVAGVPGAGARLVTGDVRPLVAAHDDWVFLAERYLFGCVSLPQFRTAQEVADRIREVLAIVEAFPRDVVPDHVDHSFDDLLARVGQLHTVDEALVFLQQLSPDERAQLARSDTPLAAFADVHEPAEAMARLQSLDPAAKMQLFAMFSKVKDQRRR
jgi:hypothetical protein